jgi:hypothetical protein
MQTGKRQGKMQRVASLGRVEMPDLDFPKRS